MIMLHGRHPGIPCTCRATKKNQSKRIKNEKMESGKRGNDKERNRNRRRERKAAAWTDLQEDEDICLYGERSTSLSCRDALLQAQQNGMNDSTEQDDEAQMTHAEICRNLIRNACFS